MTNNTWQLSERAARRLKKRYRRERRLKALGILAICLALGVLALLLGSVIARGYPAFVKTEIALEISFEAKLIDPGGRLEPSQLAKGKYGKILRQALFETFPDVRERAERRKLTKLLSKAARFELRRMVVDRPELVGTTKRVWLSAASDVDMLIKGNMSRDAPEAERRLNDRQLAWIDHLAAAGNLRTVFNGRFFTGSDSREPELAGIGGALMGSFWTLLITLVLAFPLGVAAAIYLQEFAPKNRLTDFIEVNINNLAAVPSIVFGLLGLAIFIQLFELPRSTAIVGGLTLMLMTLPTIIIATRAALAAVPPSIREAAHGVGASPVQVVFHHVLPLALPGIMTGAIIGMARALGETAPLLMIGMVAFIVDIPADPFDSATALPVQIFLWADSPERGFEEKMSAAILVLLAFLMIMNGLAVFLRKRFEIRW
jgi:phosphate transport system permease protein